MRQFLREYEVEGSVETRPPDQPNPGQPFDGIVYRVVLTRRGASYETSIHRPAGAPRPSLGEALAEIARTTSMPGTGTPAEVSGDAERLQQFLGERALTDLLFEFRHRPEDEVEQGDAVGEPARPDEMTNQEPILLADARKAATFPPATRYLLGIPIVAIGAAGILFARGQRIAAVALAASGTVATVAATTATWLWRRGHQQQSMEGALKTLTDQNASIQTGGAAM